MSSSWRRVRLEEVLSLDLDRFSIDSAATYPMVGVLSFAKGLFDRKPIQNGATSYKFFYRLKSDHIVMSQLFGWEGALALSSTAFAGKFLSPQFPTFLCDGERLERSFLGWLMRRPSFWKELSSRTTGMGDRRRTLNPQALLACEIPLPPLKEQQRIVARIEHLAGEIRQASTLRVEAIGEAKLLVSRSIAFLLDNAGWELKPLNEVLTESPRNGLSPQPEIETGGRPMLRINAVSSSPTRFVDLSATKNVAVSDEMAAPFVLLNEDVFIVRYNGDINRVAKPAIFKRSEPCNVVFPDKLMRLRPDRAKMLPDFLVFALTARSVREQVKQLGKTTAGNIGVSGANAKSFIVPVPPLRQQHLIVEKLDALQAEVDGAMRQQRVSAAELDALLPAILDRAFKGEL